MLLLISDANILIDLEEGGIIELLFRLPFDIVTPNTLYVEELEALYPHLPGLGLNLYDLEEQAMREVERLAQTYRSPSRYDCMALALAIHTACPLLTGDKALRAAAARENVTAHGTIWVVEQLLSHSLLDAAGAKEGFNKMRLAGSRLPWAEAEKIVKKFFTTNE